MRLRTALEAEVERRQQLVTEGSERLEQLRREHAEILGARDRDLKGALESHAGNLKRMLAELDQARQRSKALEAELAKEMERKTKAEAQGNESLAVEQRRLHEARDAAHEMETALRQSLADRNVELVIKVVRERESRLDDHLGEERAAHGVTRQLLNKAPKPCPRG